MNKSAKKINVVTLGCSKNLVDSEYLMPQLRSSGFEIVHNSNDIRAKIVIINTCGFIGDAKEESINTILQFAKAKEEGLIEHLFVMGCLSERYKKELENEIPEADGFFGVNNLKEMVKAVGGNYKDELIGERLLTTPKHYAYFKISEGCNWRCGFCAIPLIRGRHISVPMEQLLHEAASLARQGVKELLVIAQDSTCYGLDLYGERRLATLLSELCRIEGIEWIRLHYAYPALFPRDVITVMKQETKICRYIDIPFQHISDPVLGNMRRNISKKETLELIDYFRREIPDIALRTTLLVGYPNETEDDFEQLMDFVRETRFDRLGVFTYSEEEGTYSANTFKDNVPFEVKEARMEKIMQLQSEISRENNLKKIGSVQKVMIDRKEGDFYLGRTQYDSPEVDQEVLVSSENRLRPGEFYEVKITRADHYDLYAEAIRPISGRSRREM